ncbi:MAG: T9SS type A sorting domain-containing protein [Candidatus Marinimicrobia bacterium]|nr:T9SS type A sorting domain-containing protein [Candidatus Neomarinimicrobiota bacterium]
MLAPGDNKILDIGFTPDEVGSFSASLDIETDGGSVSIDLDGVGVDPKPKIISITDVPDDQGSRVYLEWLASGYDTLGEITQYGIWELNPENKWVSLGNVPAIQLDYYIYLAQTFGDSTVAGILWNKFKVTAHTTDPKKFYTSVVDSGYSVDNLAPEAPTGILAVTGEDNTVALSWDQPVDEDFNHFRIYRSLESEFDPTGTEPLMETTDTDFTDDEVEIGETYYYRLSSVDFSGNESDFSDIASATVVSIDESANLPTEFALSQNYPNPFNPITRINYDLPEATFVTLKIYDMLGREVQTLVNKSQQAGRYSVMFDASKLSSGVYFYKLEAGNFVEMKKMILMR